MRDWRDIQPDEVFGEWTVVAGPFGHKFLCVCACGTESNVRGAHLLRGKPAHCRECADAQRGAKLQKYLWTDKHTPKLKQAAAAAIARCTNASHLKYSDYGGRGIEVRFSNVFEFVECLTTLEGCYDPSLVLDRIDNDGHYEPGNLRFVTRTESMQNRRKYTRSYYTVRDGIVRRYRRTGLDQDVIELRAKGCTHKEIAQLHGFSISTVQKILDPNYMNDGYVGEMRCTNARSPSC